ncbi:hypothetical protein AAFF_G00156120 [Aldrovandia affinis]|uniref:IF rod domain-containing protein n=1 Tax=Aldrovandia affinis TaxID=143900 RepID=A0AAD7RNG1_9TELE|nr:hypothetical protein AAFF_G00156120 [Aldrovandia affinis]
MRRLLRERGSTTRSSSVSRSHRHFPPTCAIPASRFVRQTAPSRLQPVPYKVVLVSPVPPCPCLLHWLKNPGESGAGAKASAIGQAMDNSEARLRADPSSGALQGLGMQFEAGTVDEADFFEDCIEEFRAQVEDCMGRLGAQFKGCLDEMGDEFQDCVEDEVARSTGTVDELAAQIEECMEELGIQMQERTEGPRPQFQCLTEQAGTQVAASALDILSLSQNADASVPQLEGYVEDVERRLKGCVEEVRRHCEGGVRELGAQFAGHIEEVACLEQRRDQLVRELLELEEPMAQAVQALRAELGELRRCVARAELEKHSLQEERRLVKRQLFDVIRDCTQSQVSLETQQREVEQCAIIQGELQVPAALLGPEELPAGRIKALEEQYEPRLQALLKRKQAAAEALLETRAQAQDLRARLGPLREESQRLGLQRACLEDRVVLMQREREESVAQYRDTVDLLEESSRELRTELQIQRKKNTEIQTLKDSLTIELDLYRGNTALDGEHNPTTDGT